MIEINKLYLGNTLTLIKQLENNCIDLVITDPPFKLNKTTGSMTSSSKQDKWQGNLIAGDKCANIENDIKFSDWLGEVYRVLKNESHFYVFVNDKNVQDMLNEATKVKFKLHNILVWKKNNCTPNRWYMKNCEFVLFFHKGKSFPINDLGSSQFLEYKNISGKNKLHPTQKPTDLINKLILNSTKENDIVLDPFAGSSSTLISAIENNRQYLGFEIDSKYYNISLNRIMKLN